MIIYNKVLDNRPRLAHHPSTYKIRRLYPRDYLVLSKVTHDDRKTYIRRSYIQDTA